MGKPRWKKKGKRTRKPRAKSGKIRITEIRRLAALQCTKTEVAHSLGIGFATFAQILKHDTRVAKAWEEGRSRGNISLRRKQSRLAAKNATMAIWLGKQWLGQRDITVTQHEGGETPIRTLDVNKLNTDERRNLRRLLKRARGS